MFKNLNLKTKLTVFILIVLVIFISIFVLIADYTKDRLVEKESYQVYDIYEKIVSHNLEEDIQVMESSLKVFSENERYKEVFVSGDREELYKMTKPLFDKLLQDSNITHFYYHLPNGKNFLRIHEPEMFGDQITRFTFSKSQTNQSVASGLELGKTAYAIRVVSPYYYQGKLIGYVELGKEIDHLLKEAKMEMDGESAILVDKEFLDREKWKISRNVKNLPDHWDNFSQFLMLDTTLKDKKSLALVHDKCFNSVNFRQFQFQAQRTNFGVHEFEDKNFLCGAIPLYDAGNRLVGGIFLFKDFSSFVNTTYQSSLILLFLVVLMILIFLIFNLIIVNKLVINPINRLTEKTKRISQGNLEGEIKIKYNDEVGRLAKYFNKMLFSLRKSQQNIKKEVKDRTAELERMNKVMTDRELKMIKLKKEIKKLK